MAAPSLNSGSSSSNSNSRKKQDEKHLKILRDLVALPHNRECFDCLQRGPTYVNTTIGSFVCTKCSGLLRGLTPPHRVKSISMATFTTEEIEFLKARGNEYCKKVWLALYDANHGQDIKDEQHVKDFMTSKYERKRYYMEPSSILRNGHNIPPVQPIQKVVTSSPSSSPVLAAQAKPTMQPPPRPLANVSTAASDRNGVPTENFDPFGLSSPPPPPPPANNSGFANFDNNPIFNAVPQMTTLPTSTSYPTGLKVKAPAEDKYAALKDLDCFMKMQQESSSTIVTKPDVPQVGDWQSTNMTTNPFQKAPEEKFSASTSNPFLNGDAWSESTAKGTTNLPGSQSMPFFNFTPAWPSSNNNVTVGAINKSNNPFL